MDRAHQLANRLLETDDQEFDDAVNVGNFPLQRLLRGNGFKPLPDGHPSHRNSEECWEKQLQNGGVCRVFPMDSEREFQGRREKLWRWEKYSGPERDREKLWHLDKRSVPGRDRYESFDLPESAMVMVLRSFLQRLSTWNKHNRPIPGGSGPHAYF